MSPQDGGKERDRARRLRDIDQIGAWTHLFAAQSWSLELEQGHVLAMI